MEEEGPSNPAHELGRWGEERARSYLEEQGFEILAKNYRFGRREVDLVARRGNLVAFVEVKTRSGDRYGDPLDAVTRLKRREIEAVARQFLATHGLRGAEVRFDAVSIRVGRADARPRIEHVEDAWRPGWG
jgi:putative endonuclease